MNSYVCELCNNQYKSGLLEKNCICPTCREDYNIAEDYILGKIDEVVPKVKEDDLPKTNTLNSEQEKQARSYYLYGELYEPAENISKKCSIEPSVKKEVSISDDIDKPLYELKATNGIIKIYDDYLTIDRSGLIGTISQATNGFNTYFYKDIINVDYRRPGAINGYIRFVTAGSNFQPQDGMGSLLHTPTSIMQDPDTVILRALNKSMPEMSDRLYKIVMERVAAYKRLSSDNKDNNTVSAADEIIKFKQLLDLGIISQEEFDKKKEQLLEL